MTKGGAYYYILAESYLPASTSGKHGKVHMRPAPNQIFPQDLNIQCSRHLVNDYPAGTLFRLKVMKTDKEGTAYLSSSFHFDYEVLGHIKTA
jgi:hypothetical protein